MSTTFPSDNSVLDHFELPEASVLSYEDIAEKIDLVTVEGVPVFAEHETTDDDGNKISFDEAKLTLLADNCNRRIEETGDYPQIAIGHTVDPEFSMRGVEQPEVIGFADTFRLGKHKDRFVLLCDFHIYREDYPKLKKHPRRSPELWLHDKPDEMFLDPISLLGAEPPRLAMGVLYQAQHNGMKAVKYTAVAPSAGNVFVPSAGSIGCKKKRYSEMENNVSPELVAKVVEAFKQTDVYKWAEQQMLAEASPKSIDDGGLEGAVERNGAMNGPPEGIPPEEGGEIPPMEGEEPGEEMPPEVNLPPGEEPEVEPEGDDFPIPPTDEEPEEYGGEAGEATPPADGDTNGLEEGHEDDTTLPQRYEALRSDYASLQEELASLKEAKEGETEKRVDAERYSILNSKSKRFAINIDEEVKRCRYSQMSPKRFEEHCELIESNYSRLPMGYRLPEGDGAAASRAADRPGGKANAKKYSRSQHDAANKLCKAATRDGGYLPYKDALAKVEGEA